MNLLYLKSVILTRLTFCLLFIFVTVIICSDNRENQNMSTLALTPDNVEKVLDEMRPYLMADGGNVELVEIDGPIVRLRLQGACGTCPSSTMTLKMGIERRLREFIPEIAEVEQAF